MIPLTEKFLQSLTLAQWCLLAQGVAALEKGKTHPAVREMVEEFAQQKSYGHGDAEAAMEAGSAGYNEVVANGN